MISGPTPPHPRVILKSLLEQAGDQAPPSGRALETGLEILEQDLRVGDDLRIDFLARDACGVPVLILAIDAEDELWAPIRVLDLDLWFRDNAFLLERALGPVTGAAGAVRWSAGHRLFLVTLDVSARFHRRLHGLASLNLELFELRSLFVRGETLWFLNAIEPWQVRGGDLPMPSAPEGLENPDLMELAERLLMKIANLSPELGVRGDRYLREVRLGGRTILALEVTNDRLFARWDGREAPTELCSDNDIDRVLDAVLRSLLGEPRAESRGRRAAEAPRSVTEPIGVKLSDEEMAAFLST